MAQEQLLIKIEEKEERKVKQSFLDPPPEGSPQNIIGTKKINNRLYRFCICGKRFKGLQKIYPSEHNCSKVGERTQSNRTVLHRQPSQSDENEPIPSPFVVELKQSLNPNQVEQFVDSLTKIVSATIGSLIKPMIIDNFQKKQFDTKTRSYIIQDSVNQLTDMILKMEDKLKIKTLSMQQIKKFQKYNIPIEKILKQPQQLLDYGLMIKRIGELRSGIKNYYVKQINQLLRRLKINKELPKFID